jgi:hypothetical protein
MNRLWLIALLGLAGFDGGAPVSLAFQNGLGGYAGARDLSLSSQRLAKDNPRGATDKADAELCSYTWMHDGGYVTKTILWFDLSRLPRTTRVLSASLELAYDTWSDRATVVGHYLASPWDYDSGALGWTQRNDKDKWSQPGIGTSDLIAGKSFTVAGFKPTGLQVRAVALDPEVVQAWVRDPERNRGIVLEGPVPDAVVKIRSSEHTDLAQRPKLTVTFE